MSEVFYQKFSSVQDLDSFVESISPLYPFHHSSSHRGYLSVKEPYVEGYSGRFGDGYIIHYPSKIGLPNGHFSERYHRIDYYLMPF